MPKVTEAQLIASVCRESFKEFVKRFWKTFCAEELLWNWHIDVICDAMQEVAERVFRNEPKLHDLIINVPPGSSKSSICSILFPAWTWTRMPTARTIGASYAHPLALDLSRKGRDVVESELYQACFPEVKLRQDQNSKGYFINTKNGTRYAVGAGGSVQGMHGHFLLVDDPLNPNMAVSEAELFFINQWITNTLGDRKIDKRITVTILVMQRLHQDDPTANMALKKKVKWLRIPACTEFEIKPPELLKYYKDGLMDPVRLPKEVLDEARGPGGMGEQGFAAQFGECLIAGTLVETNKGKVPIEEIKVDDLVWTRQGHKKVLWSGRTKSITIICSVLFENGSVLTGTPDHPVWTENRSWASLESSSGGDYNTIFDPHFQESIPWADPNYRPQKLLSSMERDTSVVLGKDTLELDPAKREVCTVPSGGSIMGTSPKAMTYITKTKTQVTITLKILSASLKESMDLDIPNDYELQKIKSFLRKSVFSALPGINQRKVESIIERMVGKHLNGCGQRLSIKNTFVSSAKKVSSRDKLAYPNHSTVLSNVKTEVEFGSTSRSVDNVKRSLLPRTTEVNAAQLNVEHFSGEGIPVYDLAVEDVHEFYANGILVHNSPVPAGGGKFKTNLLRTGPVPDKWKSLIRFWDKASTIKRGSMRIPFTVGVKMGMDFQDRVWIVDVKRVRMDSFSREDLIQRTAMEDGRLCIVGVEQEPGSGGKDSALGTLRRLIKKHRRVIILRAESNKGVRADEFSVQVNSGNVYLPENLKQGTTWIGWAKDYVDELRHWPFSTYLDQGDASAGAHTLIVRPRVRVGAITE